MVAIAAVLFAFNGTAARLVLDVGLSAPRLTQIRSAGALFFIAIYVLFKNAKSLRITKKDVPFLAVYGIAGFAFVQFFYFVAITKLGVGIGLLFEFTAPVWIVLYIRFFRHEAVKKRMYAAIACTVSGLVLISQLWSNTKLEPLGIACGLIASVSLAVYFLLGDKGVHKRDTLSSSRGASFLPRFFGQSSNPSGISPPKCSTPTSILVALLPAPQFLAGG